MISYYLVSIYPVYFLSTECLFILFVLFFSKCPFKIGRFRFRARPQSFCNHRRSSATSRIAKRRERRTWPKDAMYEWTLFDKFIRVIGFICIQGRPLVRPHARFPVEQFQAVFFQLLRQKPNLDPHGAGPLARPAIRTPPRTMIRP